MEDAPETLSNEVVNLDEDYNVALQLQQTFDQEVIDLSDDEASVCKVSRYQIIRKPMPSLVFRFKLPTVT